MSNFNALARERERERERESMDHIAEWVRLTEEDAPLSLAPDAAQREVYAPPSASLASTAPKPSAHRNQL
jgi:hypothetical protein